MYMYVWVTRKYFLSLIKKKKNDTMTKKEKN